MLPSFELAQIFVHRRFQIDHMQRVYRRHTFSAYIAVSQLDRLSTQFSTYCPKLAFEESLYPLDRICLAVGVFQNGWITSKETQEKIDTLHLTLLKYPNQITV